jgi:hypothetical protein
MSTFDVLQHRGTAALLRITAALALFGVLHLVRIPLVLAERVLAGVMRRVDGYAVRQASRPPTGPINHYFPDPATDSARSGAHV